MLDIVQSLFWLSVKYNFKLTSKHIPGRLNYLSDLISRMHDKDSASKAQAILSPFANELECGSHMTYSSFLLLQECWRMDSKI
jgi:hypothetical protein